MAEKQYKIGEAAELLSLKTYVLRFWEMEFPQIAPGRTPSGQRIYTERDLALLKRIKHLLHERGLTIDGARRQLGEDDKKSLHISPQAMQHSLTTICFPELIQPSRADIEKANMTVTAAQGEGAFILGSSQEHIEETLNELRALRDMLAGGLSAVAPGLLEETFPDKPRDPES